MAKTSTRVTYETVKRMALTLPEVEESTSYGTAALKVRGKLMVRLKEDRQTVVVRCTWDERERLIALHPQVFFVTEHYRGHSWVLMHLATATTALLAPVLDAAWRLCAPRSLLSKHDSQARR